MVFKELDLKQITITANSAKELDEAYERTRMALLQKGKTITFSTMQVVPIGNAEPYQFLYVEQIKYKA